MAEPFDVAPQDDRELTLGRMLDCAPAAAWRCWTEPALIVRWFTPPPWRTVSAEMDVRPGGASLIVMGAPDGTEHPNPGVYLALEPGRRLVFTDAFTEAWVPSAKPFMVGEITFEDAPGGRTRYTARARHWTAEDRAQHEAMGFHAGWGVATEQLEAVARTL